MSEVKITINGKKYITESGTTVLNTARKNNIDIPVLCHDPRLEPYSSCYLCVVEIEGMRGLQPACSTKVVDGMKIETDNKKIQASRKTALDLLVSDHFADCIAPCKTTCPAGVDVQGYIALIEKGMYSAAVKLIKEVNPLPAICGRVCVRPCEAACNRNYMDEGAPVGIDYMKRFAADFDLNSEEHYKPEIDPPTGKKVAIIGAGPGGLSAAYFLAQKGHKIDIYEANNHPGGWLRYGIPEYRLPNDLLDKEIETITELGVNIFLNKKLGDNLSYKELKNNYDSVILTIGSQRGTLLGIEGEDADGVFSGIDFLRNMEQTGQKYDFRGKKVAVVGGGNTAMDCCRTSQRCNADKTYIIYRRTENEMPANPIEIHESKMEGVEYITLTNPVKVNKTKDGKVKSMTLIKMKLGEPDASGRRRPIPIEGSEFELEVDYILAAIGQKTQADFIDDINKYAENGKLELNKWGDIDADPLTLETGIPGIFAAGDGVTGPATIIEAIAQAGTASHSCHQYLSGEKIKPKPKEFLSKKTNFKKLSATDFKDKFEKQKRKEMPVLSPENRINFNEVELGYSEEDALAETQRCFECGCQEYYTCDLKKYSTEYNAEQGRFTGDFHERPIDFSHPYIEIDNNKCILCSRCIRICDEVAGTRALGLVERGFETFVAPAMGKSLTDTDCESCGLCISTCPTGAITENFKFKPGPFKLESFEIISNYGSSGEKISVNHRDGFVINITGAKGKINKDGNTGRKSKFGYHYYNDSALLEKPLLKTDDGGFEEITFEKAFEIIKEKISEVKNDENAFFAGARLTNEEQYLIKKLAKDAANTENVGSFHYLGRGNFYGYNSYKNTPFDMIKKAGKVYVLGAELNQDDQLVSFFVNNARKKHNTEVIFVGEKENSFAKKADETIIIKSYYYFIKAVNAYIIENGLQNNLFVKDNTVNFEKYEKKIGKTSEYAEKAGLTVNQIAGFVKKYNNENNAIIIYSEKQISADTATEIQNTALLTGKLGKTASGIISLKEKNNSHGLFDNNCFANDKLFEGLKNKEYKNLFIFGEDPAGCAVNKNEILNLLKTDFIVVQDYFMTDTAKIADLILPASMPAETGGSFTNTQRILQSFEAGFEKRTEKNNCEQLLDILKLFGINGLKTQEDIFIEAASYLPRYPEKTEFLITEKENNNRMFDYGCDFLNKKFEEEFENDFIKK